MKTVPGEAHVPGPYSCPVDGAIYAHLSGLRLHAIQHHPELSQRDRSLLRDDSRFANAMGML